MVRYKRDWERDGYLIINEAKTIKRYKELVEKRNNLSDKEIFYAFSDEQFKKGLEEHGLEREKIFNLGAGMFGTQEGYDRLVAATDAIEKKIREECDPKEVYLYEYNNHECFVSWDGDKEPARIIKRIFGEDALKQIKRL